MANFYLRSALIRIILHRRWSGLWLFFNYNMIFADVRSGLSRDQLPVCQVWTQQGLLLDAGSKFLLGSLDHYSLLLAQLHKRKDKFYSSAFIFAGTVNFFFPTWKLVVVTYSDQRDTLGHTWNTPETVVFGVLFEPSIGPDIQGA